MDGLGALGIADPVAGTLALKQGRVASEAGVALLDKTLETQKQIAVQLFQSRGIGVNLDVYR